MKVGRQPRSLRAYLVTMNIILLSLLFPTAGGMLWYLVDKQHGEELQTRVETLNAALAGQGATLLRTLSLSAGQGVASFDFSLLNTTIQEVVASDKNLNYCELVDLRGVVTASSNPATLGTSAGGVGDQQALTLLTTGFPKTLAAGAAIPVVTQFKGGEPAQADTMETIAPVYNGSRLWGGVRCAYSLKELQQQIAATRQQWDKENALFLTALVLLILAAMFLGVSIASYFTRRLVSGVDRLNAGVNAVAEGELEHRIVDDNPVCTELGSLADGFNRMTANLKQSREALDEQQRTLEQQVAERTRQLTAANQELEAFAYSVSHDLRAPLRSIDGFSQALLDDCKDSLGEQGRDFLTRIRKGAQRMGVLIDDLLSLSRVNSGAIKQEAVDLSALCEKTLSSLREREPRKNVSVRIQPKLLAAADPRLMGVAMENLLGNAWKYTGRTDNAFIEVGSEVQQGRTVFYVKDNGAGFDMKFADRLFGAFQRLHADSEFAGTGIGLATVKRVISRHGGEIWADAEPGKGATFYFTLPPVAGSPSEGN